MLTQLFSGDYSQDERRKRFELTTCWSEGAAEKAISIAEELLRETTNDPALWAAYLVNQLDMQVDLESHEIIIKTFVENDSALSVKLAAVCMTMDQVQTPDVRTLVGETFIQLKRSAPYDQEAVEMCIPFVEALLASGYLSLARDVAELLAHESRTERIDARLALLLGAIGDVIENPMCTLTTMVAQYLGGLAPSREGMAASSITMLLPFGFAAWKELRETQTKLDYLHLDRDERSVLLESFALQFQHFHENPSEVELYEVIEAMSQEILGWKIAHGYPTKDMRLAPEQPEGSVPRIPEMDDEDYLRFVDYVTDRFERIFPEHPPEHSVLTILSLLSVYAEGYRITDVHAALEAGNTENELLAYMREMLAVVEDLWTLHTRHDEVDKAMSIMEIYDNAADLCGRDLAYEVLELQLATLHLERKTIQKLIKEAVRERKKP
ncbi:MAG: hypothetical protein M5R41_04895 [Bacteroidia bacterium]|nr:hypothetical protein [Bacteroidia bacterium]